MSSIGKFTVAAASATQEIIVALASLNFDFTRGEDGSAAGISGTWYETLEKEGKKRLRRSLHT